MKTRNWKRSGKSVFIDDGIFGTVLDLPSEETARLVQAAPEMFEILEDLLKALANNPDLQGPNGECDLETFECMKDVKRILRKAKGET